MNRKVTIDRERKEAAVSFLIVLLGTLFLPQAMYRGGDGTVFSNSLFSVLAFAAGLLLANRARLYSDRKGTACCAVFAFFLSVSLVFGSRLETVENVDLKEPVLWISILVLTLYFMLFVNGVWGFLRRRWEAAGAAPGEPAAGRRELVLSFLFLLVCWGVVLAAVYPGFFVYDAEEEYIQVAARSFTNHHPLLHVLLLGGLIRLGDKLFGSINAGICLYMFFQMLVMAGVFTYVVAFLRRHGCGKWGRRLTVLYFGLFPVIPMYVLCSAKDTLFSAALLVGSLLLYELILEREGFWRGWLRPAALFVSFLFMILFRHNGLYVLAVLLPFALWAVWGAGKGKKKGAVAPEAVKGQPSDRVPGRQNGKEGLRNVAKTAAVLGGALLAALAVSSLLVFCLDASDAENQELLTVPIQQLARTYCYAPETFSEEEKQLLFEILPEEALARYAPKVSDGVKIAFDNENWKRDPGRYVRLWFSGLRRRPAVYLNAWLMTSYGFWYPDTVIDVYRGNTVFTYTYEDSSYFGFETEQPGTRESRLPWLNEVYRRLSLEVTQQRIPVVSMLFSPGFLFWLFFFGFAMLCRYGRFRPAAALLPFFLNWGTVLLGPTHLVRYVVVFWFALPAAALMVRNAFRQAEGVQNCAKRAESCEL